MIYARNTLKDQFSSLTGVGNVVMGGYVDPNLRVWIDAKKMYGLDLISQDLIAAIQAEQIEQPAGRIENSQKEFNIRVLGEANSPLDFGKIRINNRGGGPNYNPIALNRVAKVEEGISDQKKGPAVRLTLNAFLFTNEKTSVVRHGRRRPIRRRRRIHHRRRRRRAADAPGPR